MNDNDIKSKQAAYRADEGSTAQLEKAAYSSPVLLVYGAVSKLTMGNNGSNVDGANSTKKGCDRSIKENITRVGEHPLGIGLYLFDYKAEHREKSGHGRQFGVMADEVEAVMPEAVCTHPDGYKMVVYGMLGINYPVQ